MTCCRLNKLDIYLNYITIRSLVGFGYAGLGFKSIFPVSDDFLDAFSDVFSVNYLKVINEIPPRRRT